jgi:enoyl-CoA hydratase
VNVAADVADGVGRLRLTRADKHNAIDHALADEACAAIERFVEVGVVVAILSAEPPTFCSGADLTEMRGAELTGLERLVNGVSNAPICWIAAIGGAVLGGGLSLVAECPIAVASEDASFVLPERKFGILPTPSIARLEPLVGPRRALALAVTGDRIGADDAVEWGLVTEKVPAGELDERARAWAQQLAETPGLADAARRSWQERALDPGYVDRSMRLRRLLEDQLARLQGS